jgi:mannose-6-phosphate isomerase
MPRPTDSLGPIQFVPRFKPALWGGRRLRPFFGHPPADEPTGEAWVLSDYGDTSSHVATGPLAGATLRELMADHRRRILGHEPPTDGRFPLLFKFIDAAQPLSVQVHPTDALARDLEGGGNGKTEAWVIVERTEDARIFAGLRRGATPDMLTGPDAGAALHCFRPEVGECVFLPAGTVHAIGAGVLLFEVQQSSDYTYRLYDWNRVEPATGKPRELHIDKALRCVDFTAPPCHPQPPRAIGAHRERLAECAFFAIDRVRAKAPFRVGVPGECKVMACVAGTAVLSHTTGDWPMSPGTVLLLPAEAGRCVCTPGENAVVLEVSVRGPV